MSVLENSKRFEEGITIQVSFNADDGIRRQRSEKPPQVLPTIIGRARL